jgi:hypothetical protein
MMKIILGLCASSFCGLIVQEITDKPKQVSGKMAFRFITG